MTAAEGPARAMSTVRRATEVLDVLADSPTDLGTNEIARRLGTNASTVSRLLATLADAELVRRVPATGRYRLGLRLVQLGNAALARVDLRELARPHLVALNETTGETATLSVPGEQAATTVDYVQSSSSIRSFVEMGRPSVPHATAVGKVLLAYGGRLPAGRLTRFTANTITNRAALQREARQVRARGWAEARGEREDHLHTIAAGVFGRRGTLTAILAVECPLGRLEGAALRTAVDALVQHAEQLSTELTVDS